MVFHAKHHIATANNYRSRIPTTETETVQELHHRSPQPCPLPGGEGVRDVDVLVTMSQFAGCA